MQVTSVSPGIEPIPVQTTISAGYVNPPQQLTDTTFFGLNSNPPSVGDYNRVIALLRSAAQEKNANTILQTVALNYASNYQLPPYSQTPQIVLTAMTQLAVTGSAAFAAWNGNSDMQSFLEDQGVDASTAATYSTQITNDFNTALQLIRSPNSRYTPQQDKGNTVPWVAVSGEDDSPDNPVNVQMSPFPQFHLTISVNNSLGQAISLNIRYLLASNNIPNTTTVPFIPPGDEVILFIHGEGSRAEEAGNLIPPLLSIGSSVNRSFTVISLDLPSNGYSTMVPHTSVAGVPSDTTQFLGVNLGETLTAFPLLDFTQSAITTFVEQLLSTLAFSNPIVAVVGGSLGGHMALRLLASQPAWLKRVVAWSPASVEDHSTLSIPSLPLSMFTNPVLSSSNPNSSMSMSAPELSGGAQNNDSRFQFFQNVFVNDTFFGVIIQWTTVFAAVALVYPALVAAGSLFGLLFVAFLVANIFSAFQTEPPQATMWYWDNWPGKPNAINQDILDRCEIYNETFRQWHWRICEELISFDFSVLSGSFVNPLLLLVGEEDNFVDAHFLDNVKALASNLGSPGYCFTVQQTGHSIHDEHPTFLAQKIIDFTAPPFAGSPLPPPVGVQFVPGTLAVITNGDGRLEVFAVNQNDGNIWHAWQLQPGGSWQTWVPLPASLPLVDGELVSFAAIPSLYGPLQSPAVVLRNGALEIFAISSAGAPYRISQDAIGAVGGWGQWNAMVSPPGQIWSISAGVSSNIPVVVYSTDQGVFYDYSIIMSLTGGLIEGWVGPQAGPANPSVNIIRLTNFGASTPNVANVGLAMVGMALGNPETFYYSLFQNLTWSEWVVACAGPGPGNATLQDFRVGATLIPGVAIFGITRFTGNLITAIQNPFDNYGTWSNFTDLNNGPFQYGVFDVGALPIFIENSAGGKNGGFQPLNQQIQCVFLITNDGKVLEVIPLYWNERANLPSPLGQFIIDNNSDGNFGTISTLVVGVNQDSRLEVFALESNNQCYHWWQTTADPQLQNLLQGFGS